VKSSWGKPCNVALLGKGEGEGKHDPSEKKSPSLRITATRIERLEAGDLLDVYASRIVETLGKKDAGQSRGKKRTGSSPGGRNHQ